MQLARLAAIAPVLVLLLVACGNAAPSTTPVAAPLSSGPAPLTSAAPSGTTASAGGPGPVSRAACGRDEVREMACAPRKELSAGDACASKSHVLAKAMSASREWYFSAAHGNDEVTLDPTLTDDARTLGSRLDDCCYSWCSPAPVRASASPPAAPVGFSATPTRWDVRISTVCIEASEGGTSVPAAAPYDECFAAIAFGGGVTSPGPVDVPLDIGATDRARKKGRTRVEDPVRPCCYSRTEYVAKPFQLPH